MSLPSFVCAMIPQPTEQYGQIVVVSFAPFMRASFTAADASSGFNALPATAPATAVPPESFRKSLLDRLMPYLLKRDLRAPLHTLYNEFANCQPDKNIIISRSQKIIMLKILIITLDKLITDVRLNLVNRTVKIFFHSPFHNEIHLVKRRGAYEISFDCMLI
jgi:hypothetical protein